MIINMVGGASSIGQFPEFTYTGEYQLIDDGRANGIQNWRIKFLSSGILTFTKSPTGGQAGFEIDLFLVGGGGGGNASWNPTTGGGGGGGGYTTTIRNLSVAVGTEYSIVVGAGGVQSNIGGASGGASSAFGYSAEGGKAPNINASQGGYGGSGGAANKATSAGTDGSNDSTGRGLGQGTTTREFGESTGSLYSGGGGACRYTAGSTIVPGCSGGPGGGGKGNNFVGTILDGSSGTINGVDNTGGGGGSGDTTGAGGLGGSGIVVIRNHRS